MSTVTLTYDPKNALARRKLAALLATGLFMQELQDAEQQKSIREDREETEAFLAGSRKAMSNVVARYI